MNPKKSSDNSKSYQAMAQFYDKLMGEGKYLGWSNLIKQVVEKYQIKSKNCLDLACGTGNISQLLLEQGFKVVGVDISEAMISIAQKKFPQGKFICADSRYFDLGHDAGSIDFAVSFYDSLNYLLSDDDMLKTFQAVNRNLRAGAIFLFDMNPLEHIAVAQKFSLRVFEEDDLYSVFRFAGEDRFWTLDVDLFIKEPGNVYRLVKERHIERAYNKEHIAPLLEQANFKLLEVREEFKIYEDGLRHLSRLYFIAQKFNH